MRKVFRCCVFSTCAVVCSCMILSSAYALDGSLQALGSWWDAGDSGPTYGLGIRGSIGSQWALDLGYTYYGEGDDVHFRTLDNDDEIRFGGIEANVFDLGFRYTFPAEIYVGAGASYYDFDHELDNIDGEWGLYGLLGWSFGGEHIRGFIEGMYRATNGTIEYDDGFYGTYSEDFDQDGLSVNAGIMYRF
ncbi:porin family protein [Desulfogranum japonicum]|uniref:hypothetical protein n=1 Tax=Desulfogranum japonicum TaxID=231447 RepID=UPI00048CE815|nr:hypothetical protein [Desulfogranum japonicum]